MLSEEEKRRRLALFQIQNQIKVPTPQSQPPKPPQVTQPTQQFKFGQTNVSVRPSFAQQAQQLFTLPSQRVQVTPTAQPPKPQFRLPSIQAPVVKPPTPVVTPPKIQAPRPQTSFFQRTYRPQPAQVTIPSTKFEAPIGFDKPLQETLAKKASEVDLARQQYRAGRINKNQLDRAGSLYNSELQTVKNIQTGINITKQDLPSFINRYNTLPDAGQRDIRDKLTKVYTSYSSSSDGNLKANSDQAATYLSILTTPKNKLTEGVSPEVKTALEALPEVKAKQSLKGTVKDIFGALITQPIELGTRLGTYAGGVMGVNDFAKNEADYKSGKITLEQFNRNQSEINNRIAQVTGSLTGEDKGAVDRGLRALGTVAEVGTYLLPGAGIIRGVTAAPGRLGSVVAQQATLGGATSGLSAFGRTGLDTQPTDVAAAAIIGTVAQGAVPVSSALVSRTVNRIKVKPFAELTDSEKALLAREKTFHPEDPSAPTVSVPGQVPAPTPEVSVPAPRTSVPVVSDEAVNTIISNKNKADIENAVKAIYPNADKSLLQTAIDEIQKTQNPTEVRTILDSLAETKATIEAVTPEATLAQAAAREQALVAETQQPTGTIAAPRVTETASAPQAAPAGVQGTQAPTAVPGVSEAAAVEAQKGLAEAERYKVGTLRSVITKIKKTITPDFLAVESDRLLDKAAKAVGKRLKSADRLELALTQSRLARNIGIQYMQEGVIGKIIAKYSKTPEQLRDFNFYRSLKRDVEQMQDGRGPIFRNYTLEQKQQFINEYERRNPQAESDLRQLSKAILSVQDLTTKGENAFVRKADMIAVRSKKDGTQYQYWTPMERVTAEDLARVEINAYNLGALGRQRMLRDFVVNDLPVNLNFDPLTDYVVMAFRQLGQSKVIKEVAKRAEAGQIKGARMVYEGEQMAQLKGAKAQLTDIRKIIKSVGKDIKISQKQYRTIAREMAAIKGQAYKEVKRKIGVSVKGKIVPEAGPTLENINGVIKQLFSTDMATLNRLNKKYMNREPKLAEAIQKVMRAKNDLEIAKAMKKDIKSTIVDLTPDPITGRQTILGIDANGNQFRIELPPEWSRLLQGLDKAQLDEGFKIARAIQDIFRQAWVGILNPPFQLSTAIWNAVWSPVVAREGYKLYAPSAVKAGLKTLVGTTDFQRILNANGAINFGGDLRMLTSDSVADALGSQASNLSKLKWYLEIQNGRGFRRSWKAMNEWGGKIDQATRSAAATAAYNKARKQKFTEEQAIAEAVMSWNNVLPDFSNVSQAVKTVDAIIPFTAASVAGTRTTLRAFKDRPAQTIAKLGVLSTAIGSVYAYNLATEQGQAFYKDMKDSKKDFVLDNNLIIVLPGATKDAKTGEWSGVIKIPLAPEARPVNTALRSAFLEEDLGAKVGKIALSFGDFLTGKLRDASSPAMQVYSGMVTGKDPRTGREIWDQTMDNNEKAAAVTKYLQANLGLPGAMSSGDAWDTFVKGFVNRVYGAKGATDAGMYYINQDKAIKNVGLDRDELYAYFSSVSPPKKDLSGNIIKDKTYYDQSSKALAYKRYPKTFDVDKQIDAANRKAGKPGDPLFDLTPQEQEIVLNIQWIKDTQDAKALAAINKDWLDAYYQKRGEYFDKILSSDAKKAGGIDALGIAIPVADKTTQSKIQEATALQGADKAKFYADNPEVTDYFNNLEEYNRSKRKFLGLPLLDQYPEADPEVKTIMDQYNSLPKGDGPLKRDGTPSSPTRSAWIRNNAGAWNLLTEQWNKQNIYNLQREAGLAVFEGIDIPQKTLDKNTQSYGSTARFGGTASQNYLNTPPAQRQYLNQLVSDIAPFKLPEAPKLKKVPKIKTKKPSTPRRTIRIKLQ